MEYTELIKPKRHSRKRMQEEFVDVNDENAYFGEDPAPRKKGRISTPSDRHMPDALNSSTEFGSPHKFWAALCEKDEAYQRDAYYLRRNPAIGSHMRVELLRWLMEVCEHLHLHRETFYLTVDYFDRYMSKGAPNNEPSSVQLIGTACLLLSTKMEEIYPPKIHELVELTGSAYTARQLRDMEEIILTTLEWHCSPVTSVQWLAFYLHLIFNQDKEDRIEQCCNNSKGSVVSRPPAISESMSQSIEWDTTDISISIFSQGSDIDVSSEFDSQLDLSQIPIDSRSIQHSRQISVPQIMRDDFMGLTKILDICSLDMEFLRFTYSQIAAAIIVISYEPRDLVERITGFDYADLKDAIFFVEPYAKTCRGDVLPGVSLPHFSGIEAYDQHNIQVANLDSDKLFDSAQQKKTERQRLIETVRPRRKPLATERQTNI